MASIWTSHVIVIHDADELYVYIHEGKKSDDSEVDGIFLDSICQPLGISILFPNICMSLTPLSLIGAACVTYRTGKGINFPSTLIDI